MWHHLHAKLNLLGQIMNLRFVHAADLHLDSPFSGLRAVAPDTVTQSLYAATFDAYNNIIDLCISERVDALLVAGDIYDGADRSLRAQRAFIEGLRRLETEGHSVLRMPWQSRSAGRVGGTAGIPCRMLSVRRRLSGCARIPLTNPDRAVVYGISYPTRDVYDNLALRLGPVADHAFSIGLLHANVGGNPDHALYAPCSLDDLVQSGIDYWALGHVHTRHILNDRSPTVVYPGNSQGRHPNETGARGAYLVEVDAGGNVRLDFRATDTVRWERAGIDIGVFETEQDLLDKLHSEMQTVLDGAEGRSVVSRITLTGRGEVNRLLRQPDAVKHLLEEINDAWARRLPFAWCERIEDATASPLDRGVRREGADFLAEVLRTVDQMKGIPMLLTELQKGLPDLYRHGPLPPVCVRTNRRGVRRSA